MTLTLKQKLDEQWNARRMCSPVRRAGWHMNASGLLEPRPQRAAPVAKRRKKR